MSAPRPWLTPPPFPLTSLRRWLVVLTLVTPVGACSDVAPSPAPTPRVAIDAARPRTPYWTDWLARYVAVDTTVPPGHEADALPILTEALTELGLSPTSTTWGDRRANVWATLEAPAATRRGGALILLHHIDVVPTERARWTTDPLGAARKDGRLYGRGTQDMKVFAALHLAALEHLVAERSRLTRDVIFLAVSDEEVSGEGARRFVDHVLPTLRAEYLLDEGGFALHEFLPGHDVVVIATAQKRAAKLRLVASGRAGHGSRPIAGSGPEVLMTALARVQASPAPMRLEPYNAPLFAALAQLTPWPRSALLARLDWPGMLWALEGRLARDESLAPVLRDTAAITVVSAGEKVNVIPSTATAVLDVRLLPDTPLPAFVEHLRGLLADLPVEILTEEAPLDAIDPSPTDDALYRALVEGVTAHHPSATVVPWLMVGASDARFFRPRGLKAYGFGPVFMARADIEGIHGHDESVSLDALAQGMRTYTEALDRFLLAPR